MLRWYRLCKTAKPFSRHVSSAAALLRRSRTRRTSSASDKQPVAKALTRYDVLNMLRFQNNPEKALQILLSTSPKLNFRHLRSCYDTVVDKLVQANRPDMVEMLIERMKRQNPSGPIFILAISLYGRAAMPDFALRTFNDMPHFNLNQTLTAFNSLLHALVKSRKFDLAQELYGSRFEFGIIPDNHTYNTLIWAQCLQNRTEAAFQFLACSIQHGVGADTVTFNTLMDYFLRRNRIEEVHRVLSVMAKTRCAPDAATCDILIMCFCREGRVTEALMLLKDMLNGGFPVKVHSYNVLLKSLCQNSSSMVSDAGILIAEMTKRGCRPNVVTYSFYISGLCTNGQVDLAWRLFGFVLSRKWVPAEHTCKAMAVLLRETGRFEQCLSLADKMHRWEFVPDLETWTAFVESWSHLKA